jgi:hypothetical protein
MNIIEGALKYLSFYINSGDGQTIYKNNFTFLLLVNENYKIFLMQVAKYFG